MGQLHLTNVKFFTCVIACSIRYQLGPCERGVSVCRVRMVLPERLVTTTTAPHMCARCSSDLSKAFACGRGPAVALDI